jgi:tRNA pseudouridine38/39 synthase
MDQILVNRLLDCVSEKLAPGAESGSTPSPPKLKLTRRGAVSQKIFDGGDYGKLMGDYVPVLKRPVQASITQINDRYAQTQGFATAAEMTSIKNWRTAVKEAKEEKKRAAMEVDE